MSYTLDTIGTPSYRRVMDSRTSYSRTSSSPSSGFRSRTAPSTMSVSYKRTTNVPVVRAYGSAVLSSTDSLDLSQSSLLNGDFKRSNEKEQLQGLNDRFAGYIDKVHFLEQQNREIEAEIQALRQKQVSQSQLGDVYDQELRELRSTLEQIHRERMQVQLDADHIEEDIQRLTERYQDEARVREETDAAIRAMKKDADDSALIKAELDKKVQSLQDEVDFLRRNHEEEVNDLLSQLQATQVTAERKDYQKTDLTAALREIRSQLDGHSSKNLQHAEDWFMSRYSKLTEAAEQNKDAIKTARDEIAEYRRQLQTKNIELESVRSTKESLERQLNDIEDRHNGDLASLQETIHQLDNELKSTKWEMARHLREYQDLLNVKMALDIEIAAYRKLLEGEETRFSSFSGSIGSPSFPYRQPVTPGKVKAEAPKLKVQHKFVEEIIEETRVEDEKSDLDEALAEVVEELSAEKEEEEEEKGGEEEEEKQEEEEEEEEAAQEEEQAEEEEVVTSTQAAVSASPPGEEEEEEEEEKGDKDDNEEDKEGEGEAGEEAEEEGEGEGAEEKEEEGGEEEGEGEGGEEEGQEGDDEGSGVEETVLSTKVAKEEAVSEKVEEAEKEETTEEEEKKEDVEVDQKGEDKEDAGSDKESKDAKEKEEDEDKTDEAKKEEKDEEVKDKEEVAKIESPKAEAKKEDKAKSEDKEDKKSDSEDKEDKKSDSEEKEDKKSDAKDKEDKKSDSEGEAEKESKAAHKEDTAINGEVAKADSDDEQKKKSEQTEEEEKKEVVTNGVSESPAKDDGSQKVVITKTVETITMGEDGAKHVTTSVTVTETMDEASEVVHEQMVSSKKMEKVTSQTVKQVTETQ